MPYSRQRPRLAPTERVTLRLTTAQRDQFLAAPAMPKDLGHTLHRAPVRDGKLSVRVTREWLATLIAVLARQTPAKPGERRRQDALLRYLEAREDQFAEPDCATG